MAIQTATVTTARDDMISLVNTIWEADSATQSFPLLFEDDPQNRPTEVDPASGVKLWARVRVRHLTRNQASLSNCNGVRRWRGAGLLTIELFTPQARGLVDSDAIVQGFFTGLEGIVTTNGVWLQRVRSTEIGPTGPWFQVNIFSDFQYDQLH